MPINKVAKIKKLPRYEFLSTMLYILAVSRHPQNMIKPDSNCNRNLGTNLVQQVPN